MNTKHTLIIAAKIFGLYLFVRAALLIPNIFSLILLQNYTEVNLQYILSFVITLIVYVLLALFLIRRSDGLVSLLIKREENIDIDLRIAFVPAMQIAFVILGTYIIIEVFPYLLQNIYTWIKLEITKEYEYDFNFNNSNLFYSIIRITLGFLIVTNSRNLVQWIASKNRASVNEIPEP